MKTGIFTLLCLSLGLATGTAHARQARCSGYQFRNVLAACTLEKLSWVEVRFFNDLSRQALKRNGDQIENDIRRYARRAFPRLKHEVVDPQITYLYSHKDAELLKKAKISCLIGVTKSENDALAAVYVQCELYTFWKLKELQTANFRTAVLGIATSDTVDDVIENKYIKGAISDLGDQYRKSLSVIKHGPESRKKTRQIVGKN